MLTAEQIKKVVVADSERPISITEMAQRLKMKDGKLIKNVFAKHKIAPVLRAGSGSRRFNFYALNDEQANVVADDVVSRLETKRRVREAKAAQREMKKAMQQQGLELAQPEPRGLEDVVAGLVQNSERQTTILERHAVLLETLAKAWGVVA
jgi:polyhydroxyalkanoate synthesis regulator phasin